LIVSTSGQLRHYRTAIQVLTAYERIERERFTVTSLFSIHFGSLPLANNYFSLASATASVALYLH